MKKVFMRVLAIAFVFLFSVSCFAQQGDGKMGGHAMMQGQEGMGQGHMMQGQQGMGQGHMMQGMMGQMSEMMGKMSGMMKTMNPEDIKEMSELMNRMSRNMMDMSKMMSHGEVSEKEMAPLEGQMRQMRNRLSEMQRK